MTLDRLDYHDKTNTVTPTLVIDNGPMIEVAHHRRQGFAGAAAAVDSHLSGAHRRPRPVARRHAQSGGLFPVAGLFRRRGGFRRAVADAGCAADRLTRSCATPATSWWASRSPAIISSIPTPSASGFRCARPASCATATGAIRRNCATTTGTRFAICTAPTDFATCRWRPPRSTTTTAARTIWASVTKSRRARSGS